MSKDTRTTPTDGLSVIAIIPARGGSKGIPRKNIVTVAGKPLISYIIGSAQQSRYISEVIVSTDDVEIASVAREYGAEVVMRPKELSGDDSPSELALLHAIDELEKCQGKHPDIIVFLQCTCPLTSTGDIDNTISRLMEENADTSFTGTPSHYFLWTVNDKGEAVTVNHDKAFRKRRQDCEPQYIETGSVYALRCEGFLAHKSRFFGKTVLSVIPPTRILDIDDPDDIPRAEEALRKQNQVRMLECLPQKTEAVIFDFDGVFTDNRVIVHEDGGEAVLCNRGDGLGISLLKKTGCQILVLSKEKNPVVQKRTEKLGIPCVYGIDNKKAYLLTWLKERDIDPGNVIFLGNDITDIECIEFVGCGAAVADANERVKNASRLILDNNGGHGAVRELCDMVISRQIDLNK
jgi:N-acylneuraminate cytidylyltransferase